MTDKKLPNSRANLDKAIEREFGRGDTALRTRTILADVIVAQMLPEGVVKGGSSLKMRYGNHATRFTRDLGAARQQDIDGFIQLLQDSLVIGWSGFTGRIVTKPPASPEGVPAAYVMQPFEVKLSYNGKPWSTVRLEVGQNEIGDADEADYFISSEIVDMFAKIGLPKPAPVALMRIHHQIAQKIHGLTEPESKRAHDLIDLQIIVQEEEDIELKLVKETCARLFAYRNAQTWPPVITRNEGWSDYYSEQQPPASVHQTIDEAIEWGNSLIDSILKT